MALVVLNAQPTCFESFDDSDFQKWGTPHWFALYTRSRHEKLIERELKRKGIESFLPLRKIVRRWSDRQKVIHEPLFKGYLFVHTSLLECSSVLNTKGAIRFVGSSNALVEVPHHELEAIQRFIQEEIQIDPFPYLKIGDLVRVKTGPFKGIEGFVLRKGKQCRLIISCNLIMQSASVEIDEACLERL